MDDQDQEIAGSTPTHIPNKVRKQISQNLLQ